MIQLPADEHSNAGCRSAEVAFADVLRDAARSEDAGNMRELAVEAQPHPPMDPELEAAEHELAHMLRVDVFAGGGEVGRLLV